MAGKRVSAGQSRQGKKMTGNKFQKKGRDQIIQGLLGLGKDFEFYFECGKFQARDD